MAVAFGSIGTPRRWGLHGYPPPRPTGPRRGPAGPTAHPRHRQRLRRGAALRGRPARPLQDRVGGLWGGVTGRVLARLVPNPQSGGWAEPNQGWRGGVDPRQRILCGFSAYLSSAPQQAPFYLKKIETHGEGSSRE